MDTAQRSLVQRISPSKTPIPELFPKQKVSVPTYLGLDNAGKGSLLPSCGPARVYDFPALNPIKGVIDVQDRQEVQKAQRQANTNSQKEHEHEYGSTQRSRNSSIGLIDSSRMSGKAPATPQLKAGVAPPAPASFSLCEHLGRLQCNLGGGEFLGLMTGLRITICLFRSPKTGSSLALPISDMSAEEVRKHIKASDIEFGVE